MTNPNLALSHGEWKNHKYIRKYKSPKSGKDVYVYKDKSRSKSLVDTVGENLGIDDVPDSYDPDMVADTWPDGRKGYTHNGFFLEGDYETARRQAYIIDISISESRANEAYDRYIEKNTIGGRIQEACTNIAKGIKELPDNTSTQVKKGKNFIADILEGAADKLRD